MFFPQAVWVFVSTPTPWARRLALPHSVTRHSPTSRSRVKWLGQRAGLWNHKDPFTWGKGEPVKQTSNLWTEFRAFFMALSGTEKVVSSRSG